MFALCVANTNRKRYTDHHEHTKNNHQQYQSEHQ